MGHITEKPAGLAPTPNDLDNIPDDLLAVPPANLLLGNLVLLNMEHPPTPGQYVDMRVTFRTRKDGREALTDGTLVHFRSMTFISARVVTEPYSMDEDDEPPQPQEEDPPPGLFDHDGAPSAEAAGGPESLGEIIDGSEFVPPEFSDRDDS